MKSYYNQNKLIKVEVRDFRESDWYEWRKERKFLGVTISNAGVYDMLGAYCGNLAPEKHVIRDGEVYEKPKAIFYYQGEWTKEYVFDSYEDAQNFAEGRMIGGRFKT